MAKRQSTVSEAYLIGVSEGRSLLKKLKADKLDSLETRRATLLNVQARLKMGFGGDALEALRGERDFWKLQVENW